MYGGKTNSIDDLICHSRQKRMKKIEWVHGRNGKYDRSINQSLCFVRMLTAVNVIYTYYLPITYIVYIETKRVTWSKKK